MTKKEHDEMIRPLKLVTEYYKYFLNLDVIKGAYVESGRGYNANWEVTWDNPTIFIRKYKTENRRKEAERLKALLIFSPDIDIKESPITDIWSQSRWTKYEVTYVNPKLPSIKNNSLGFERED